MAVAVEAEALDKLNATFGIPGALEFRVGAGGFTFGHLATAEASAEVCLYGGHVTAFVPAGEPPVIWLSPDAVYRPGKAIRGGIPICWPWFLSHPTEPELPSHGTARISEWEVVAAERSAGGEVRLKLLLPGEHGCELSVTLSRTLKLELTTTNHSHEALVASAALHSYFCVGDISKVALTGLQGVAYLDDVHGGVTKLQDGEILIQQEVDRRYQETGAEVLIRDESLGRTIRVSKSGSATTVVWNPWIARAAELGDMPDDGYQTMVCVEAANFGRDQITLAPGESQTLGTEISLA